MGDLIKIRDTSLSVNPYSVDLDFDMDLDYEQDGYPLHRNRMYGFLDKKLRKIDF